VERPGVEGDGVRQVLPPHQLHDEGLPGGSIQRLHGPEEEREEEDVPEAHRPRPAEAASRNARTIIAAWHQKITLRFSKRSAIARRRG